MPDQEENEVVNNPSEERLWVAGVEWGNIPIRNNEEGIGVRLENFVNEEFVEQVQERAVPLENRFRPRRNANNVGQVLDTVGIELESIALSKDRVSHILASLIKNLGNNFKVHRDGSSEINVFNVPINNNREMLVINAHTEEAENLFRGKYHSNVMGYELISVPMDISTAEMTLYALLPALAHGGDFISERCATHVHVGGMKNLGFLKNCLKLGLWFDEVFYSLAHLDGERFRGYSNNAIYARPLINGPYFKYDRNFYQVLNWQQALKATDLYDFFACYGVNVEGEIPKYHPGRYFSINLFSVPRIGTVEFRHFNQSFNPPKVTSVTKLCQLFVEVAMKSRLVDLKSLEVGDVFTLQSPSYYIRKLYKFLDMAESLGCDYSLDMDNVRELERTILSYKGIGIEDREVLTHCRDFDIPRDFINIGELKRSKNKPIPDGHIDIHNIKYQSII